MSDLKKVMESAQYDRVTKELELSDAIEAAIKLGKEITMLLDEQKPVTKCLVAQVLHKEYSKRWPMVFKHLEKLGI